MSSQVNPNMQEEEQATQPTQVQGDILPPIGPDFDEALWGYFQPCSRALSRKEFHRHTPTQTIGRSRGSTVHLKGTKISNHHAEIVWDQVIGRDSLVTLKDSSTNGTFVNGMRFSRGQTAILRDGNEVGFGTTENHDAEPHEDYRYIFRFTATGKPTSGLYAHYDVAHELGKGTFATVMRAINRTTGEPVAIKMIHKKLRSRTQRPSDMSSDDGTAVLEDTHSAASFKREISILEKMDHPNICGLRETFWEDKGNKTASYRCYLVLELVNGGDLLDYIANKEGLSEPQSKAIAYQMCRALGYVHKLGIAHRDLKPENVLLTRDDPPIVKVADFGLAKALDSMTMLRTMCGTPSYLAPEVVDPRVRRDGYSQLVDSWSVGVIIFSMLTNLSPFLEDEEQDIQTRIRERTIDWVSFDQQRVSRSCKTFVERLLMKDPARRLQLLDSLRQPWFKGYQLPPHHVIPDNYWADTTRNGPIIRDDKTGEIIRQNGVSVQPSDNGCSSGLSGYSSLPAVSQLQVDDVDESHVMQDEATPPPQPSFAAVRSPKGSQSLQRRADIFRRAQEDPNQWPIFEPPADMVLSFAYDHSPGPSKPLKRGIDAMEEGGVDGYGNDDMEVDPVSPRKGKSRTAAGKGADLSSHSALRRSGRNKARKI